MNSIAARMVYQNAMVALQNAFADNPAALKNTRPAQGYLRTELQLVAGTTSYNFNLLVNENNPQPFNTEKRLALQNSFVASEVGLFFGNPSSTTDTTFKLRTYPNFVDFAQAAALQAFYQGSMNVIINNVRYMESWDLWRHYLTAQTQQTAALGAGSPNDQLDGKADGFYPIEPNLVFIGSKDNRIQITLPAGLSAVDTNARVILIFRGILAQNSTVVQ